MQRERERERERNISIIQFDSIWVINNIILEVSFKISINSKQTSRIIKFKDFLFSSFVWVFESENDLFSYENIYYFNIILVSS
jgi:hypothetical protein